MPFHTQLYEEGSFNEENSKAVDEKSSEIKEVNNNKDEPHSYDNIVKLDLQTINNFLPSIVAPKYGMLEFVALLITNYIFTILSIFIETNMTASKNLKERREMMMKNNFAHNDQGKPTS